MGEDLEQEETEHLARALVAARKVRLRHQFFAWTQGALQALIPHEILLIGVADNHGHVQHERFNACRYFRDEHFSQVCRTGGGLINELCLDWQGARQPRLISEHHDGDWPARLAALELRNLAFHCQPLPYGQGYGYVSFSRVRGELDARLALYLDLLTPTLLGLLATVLAEELQTPSVVPGRAVSIATPRELEILSWVRDGKTNDEIAAILGLSSLTVKNHLFRATKKLDVRTRGQAVARAIALGLLSAHSPQASSRGAERRRTD
jgi:transcriptional regulator EpsA